VASIDDEPGCRSQSPIFVVSISMTVAVPVPGPSLQFKACSGTSSVIMADNFVKVDSDNRRYPVNFDSFTKATGI